MATISTHCGHKFSQGHNRRDKKITSKEKHIDENGHHETWLDIPIKKAYSELFDESVEEYNATQKRKDRQISSYYDKIKEDGKKHLGYEMIVGVYDESVDDETKREILREFFDTWDERNPNLVLIGAYLHNDEQGEMHLHLDYIPCYESDKGMHLQNGLKKALEQQGIGEGTSIHETRQINWQKRENAFLEQLCKDREIEVEHKPYTREHMHTLEYKLHESEKEKRGLQAQNQALEQQKSELVQVANERIHKGNERIKELSKENRELKVMQEETYKAYKKEYEENHKFDKYNGENEWASDWDLRK